MRFDTSMQTRLEQRMKLAPRMIQSMEILQLPLMALEERIEQELEANPTLEIQEPDAPGDEHSGDDAGAGETIEEGERVLEVTEDGTDDFERLQKMVEEYDDYFDEDRVTRSRVGSSDDDGDGKMEAMQNTAAEGIDLRESLLEQLHYLTDDALLRELGETIIQNLDDNGYLRLPLEELLSDTGIPATLADAEAALELVQRVEPAGVGARDLQECLLLQLDRLGSSDDLVRRIVEHHLSDVEANRYPQLSRKLGASIDEIKQAVEIISHLNPKPGAALTTELVPPVTPDVLIEYDEKHDDYRVTVRDERVPQLRISAVYRRMLKQRDLDKTTREFVARNVRSARWLMESIEQRRSTLSRVVQSIVRFQRPFLDNGPENIQPLKMQQVADDVHLHVGTISRAVDEKYAETPWGIFPLRKFFTGGTESADGEVVARDAILNRLREIIAAEDKSSPMSDEEIMKRFNAEGFDLKHRTITKYRTMLGIPTSRKRKQF